MARLFTNHVVVLETLLEYVEIATHLLIYLPNVPLIAITVAKELDILWSIALCKPLDVPSVEPVVRTTCTETAQIISVMNAINKNTLLLIAPMLLYANRIRLTNVAATPMKLLLEGLTSTVPDALT